MPASTGCGRLADGYPSRSRRKPPCRGAIRLRSPAMRGTESETAGCFAPAAGRRARAAGAARRRRALGRHLGRRPSGLQRAILAQEQSTERLLDREAVVGTAVSEGPSGEAEIVVFAKHPVSVASTLGGVPVDVEVTGPIAAVKAPDKAPGGGGHDHDPHLPLHQARSDRHLHRQRRRVLGGHDRRPGEGRVGTRLRAQQQPRLRARKQSPARQRGAAARPLRHRLRLQRRRT